MSDHSETRAIADRDVDIVHMREYSYVISEHLAHISQYEADGYLATVGEVVDAYKSMTSSSDRVFQAASHLRLYFYLT
jgi:hypothetical protein